MTRYLSKWGIPNGFHVSYVSALDGWCDAQNCPTRLCFNDHSRWRSIARVSSMQQTMPTKVIDAWNHNSDGRCYLAMRCVERKRNCARIWKASGMGLDSSPYVRDMQIDSSTALPSFTRGYGTASSFRG